MIETSNIPVNSINSIGETESITGAGISMRQASSNQINICSTSKSQHADLISILEGLLPARFISSEELLTTNTGEIIVGDSTERKQSSGKSRVSSLRVPRREELLNERKLVDVEIHFADDPGVPFPFRGRSLRSKVGAEPTILPLSGSEKVLASSERGPVWSLSQEGGVRHFRSGFALPRVPPNACLADVINGECFLEILPLLHWLREICSERIFHGPPLRACFVFDDPNLHWPCYGRLDFRQIAVQAKRENYHVAFATIPLDAWFVHRATAKLFRSNTDRLSLVVHGNNHTKLELARNYSEPVRISLLQQAIQRIERLELKTGLRVSRIMVPPHGGCSEEMLQSLPMCGFEAACISHGSLRAHNKVKLWTRNLGLLPSEVIRGCPVLPRWALSGNVKNTILLAAFLNQAIILRGHHQDLKNGVELLDDLARFINGLGNVTWSNMTDLSRSNFQWRMDGTTCQLKPLGRRVNWSMPREASGFLIESSFTASSDTWQIQGLHGSLAEVSAGKYFSFPAPTNGAISLEISSNPLPSVSATVSTRTPSVAFVRRLLTEGRDRFLSSR